jgi:hypothetical protein
MVITGEGLIEIVRREVADYAGAAYKAKTCFVEHNEPVFAVLDIPNDDYPVKLQSAIIVMARIIDELVVIDVDITDKPLFQELLRCGIPREQMILRYAGETLPKPEPENPAQG